MYAPSVAWPSLHTALLCPPAVFLAGFVRLILLRSLLLDFPCATPAKPISLDRSFLKVRYVGRMAQPPHCPPVPTLASFVRLILLRSLLLEFPCAAPATPIAQDLLFLNVRYVRCVCLLSWNL